MFQDENGNLLLFVAIYLHLWRPQDSSTDTFTVFSLDVLPTKIFEYIHIQSQDMILRDGISDRRQLCPGKINFIIRPSFRATLAPELHRVLVTSSGEKIRFQELTKHAAYRTLPEYESILTNYTFYANNLETLCWESFYLLNEFNREQR